MPRATIKITDNFKRYGKDVERGLERGLRRSASDVEREATHTPTNYNIRQVMSDTHKTDVTRGRRGPEIRVYWDDFLAYFFEKGTYARKGAARSSRAKSVEGNRGVKPVRFGQKALKRAFPKMIANISREVPK